MRAMVVTNRAEGAMVDIMFRDLAKGLSALGVQTELALVTDFDQGYGRICDRVGQLAAAGDDFFLVDANCRLRYGTVQAPLPHRFCFVTDAPWSQMEHILDNRFPSVLGYVDKAHQTFYGDLGLKGGTAFFPHGGPDPDPDPLPMAQRDIGVLFVGNLSQSPNLQTFDAMTGGYEPWLRQACRRALDRVIHEGCEPYLALRDALVQAGHPVPGLASVPWLVPALRLIGSFAEAYNRRRLLTSLGKVPVTCVGQVGGGFFDSLPDTVTFLGLKSGDQVRDMMMRARIVLNSVTVFPHGSHERIWYGMAAGAVVCCDRSDFVLSDFSYDHSLLSLDQAMDSQGGPLADRLADLDGLDQMAAQARRMYAARHTWTERAGIIVDMMESRIG